MAANHSRTCSVGLRPTSGWTKGRPEAHTTRLMENVIAVGLILPKLPPTVAEEHLEELTKLIESAGGSVIRKVFAKRNSPDPGTYIGKGKAEEVKSLAERHEVSLIVFDDDLSPAQVRNLEKLIGKR